MTIENQRAIQRQQQQTAIEQRRSSEGISRIGERDPETGRYQVIAPDGSASRDGLKVFTADAPGTPVLSTDRTDGLKVLDSRKPIDRPYFPEPLATPPLYREGRVFEIPELKKSTKGPIHILFADQGKLWVGGHRDDPEEVIVPTFTGIVEEPELWADLSGWVFSQRNIPNSNIPNLKIYSYDSEGGAYSSPATPDGKFISSSFGTGYLGVGMYVLRESNQIETNRYVWHKGAWTFVNAPFTSPPNQDYSHSVNLPLGILDSVVVSRASEFADGYSNSSPIYQREWISSRADRNSLILQTYYVDYQTGMSNGNFELVTKTTVQPFYAYAEQINTNPTMFQPLPQGMYTDGQFTRINSTLTELNNLKSGPGLITIATTNLARITTTEQVEAFKIPATASIITYCTTLS